MKKTTLALAILFGGFAAGTDSASAAPIAPAGIQAESNVTQVSGDTTNCPPDAMRN